MTTTLAKYEALSFEKWQQALGDTFCDGAIPHQPFQKEERQIFHAFRHLCPPSQRSHSRMDYFLLGFRTLTLVDEFDDGLQVDLDNDDLPEVFAYRAVESALETVGERPKTPMEIVVMHHLETYIKALDDESKQNIFVPSGMAVACFWFICGYSFVDRLHQYLI